MDDAKTNFKYSGGSSQNNIRRIVENIYKNKKIALIISIAVICLIFAGLLIGVYFWWNDYKKAKTAGIIDGNKEASEKIMEGATKGTLPSISNNPLDSKPNLNPVEKTNPIKDIKINPFE